MSHQPLNAFPTPPGSISIPSQGPEHVAVLERDWLRLRAKVETMSTQQRQYAAVAWTAVGICGGAVLSALAWFPAYDALRNEDQLQYTWVGPTMVVVGIAALVVAGLMFWAATNEKTRLASTVTEVLEDMDDMPLAPVGGTQVGVGSSSPPAAVAPPASNP